MAINEAILDNRYGYKGEQKAQEIIQPLKNNYNSYAQFIVEGGDPSAYNRDNRNIIERIRVINGPNGRIEEKKEKGETREIFIYEHTGDNISNSGDNTGAGEVYVIAHGWNPGIRDFLDMADKVKAAKPGATVLVVDWSQASETQISFPYPIGVSSDNYKAVTWIGEIARGLYEVLTLEGFTGSSINFIGHSFGSYLASATAQEFGKVNTITALDPASNVNTFAGYDLDPSTPGRQQPVKFNTVSNYSRAYVGSRSISGNEGLAISAHESFQMDFGIGVRDISSEHGYVVRTFNKLIDPLETRKLAQNPFSSEQKKPHLLSLDDNQSHPQFREDISGFHQGVISVNAPDQVNFLIAAKNTSQGAGVLAFGTTEDDYFSPTINPLSIQQLFINGDNTFYGDKGNDKIIGGFGDDKLHGGEGNDTLNGSFGFDILYGDEGNDILDGLHSEGDLAVFSDKFENYEYSISGDTITFAHTKGTQIDGTDTLKNIEYASFGSSLEDNVIVPLPLKDGPEDTNKKTILNNNGNSIYASLGSSIYMYDRDADYKINLSSSQQNLQYNFAYIIDVSGSMSGTPLQEAKSAYTSLTNSLISSGIADVSQFVVIPFKSSASQSGLLDATEATSTIQGLGAGGGTSFEPALDTAYQFFSGLPDGGTNIAYFLSDGRSSNGFETVANSLKSVADVQAYGIGGGVDTNQLTKVDSDGNISVLQNPSDLTAEFNNSDFSADSIAQINLLLDGTVVETIQSNQLIEDSLGLSFEGSIDNLDISFGAENLLTAEIFFTDATPTSTVDFTIASGLAEVTDDNPFDEIVNGTAGDDTIRLGAIDLGSNSGGGNDKVVGNDFDNIIDSGSGNDIVFGNDGNDTITTGSGQDRIDGGDGIDTVVYTSTSFTDSSVQKVGNVITVNNTDTLTNVEFIQFSDTRISTQTLQTIPFLTASDITIAEGNSSNTIAQFTFNLSSAASEDVQLTYSTLDVTAIAGEDYVAKTGQVTIEKGESSGAITLEILGDTVIEEDEALFLNFEVNSGATFADGATTATAGVNIVNDDSLIDISLTGVHRAVIEGNPSELSNFSLTLNRFGSLNESDTVEVELVPAGDNPAQASDLVDGFSSRQVTFAPDEDRKTIDISINPDRQIEADETFGVRLTSVSGSALVLSEELIFTILDDDEQIITGNTINEAYQINLNGNGTLQTFTGSVDSTDSNDYYRFSLGSTSDFNLELNGLSDNANVWLLDSNGDTIVSSNNYGTDAESINETLFPGDYYINVSLPWGSNINTSYNLDVSTTALDFVGNTINDAYQINLNGDGTSKTFKEWVGTTDSSDYYKLTIGSTSDFNLELNGLLDNANVRLLDSNGDTIVGSYNFDTTSESINETLFPGDYYINVNLPWGYNINTSYNLDVSTTALDFAGNTINDAYQINLNGDGTSKTFKEWVGTTDSSDYYKLTIGSTSDFNLELNGLSDNANVWLLDSNGDTIVGSYNFDTTSESINETLFPGDYYIHVNTAWGYNINTSYNLDVSTTALDFAGNTINDAYQINLNGNGTSKTFKEWVGSSDSNDYYKLTIGSTSDFNLELNGLLDNANVRLLDSNGDTIVGSYNFDTTSESINETLFPGDYYINVNLPWGYNINTSYNLDVSTTALDFAGNTINDAYQINLNGNGTSKTFKEWVGTTDSSDYYKLTIGSTSDFNLELNGLSDNANVWLLDSNGDTIVGSYNYGTDAESINQTLFPGDYYIHVNPAWGYNINTSYNLDVSVDALNN